NLHPALFRLLAIQNGVGPVAIRRNPQTNERETHLIRSSSIQRIHVGVGEGIQPRIEKYRSCAKTIYFLVCDSPVDRSFRGWNRGGTHHSVDSQTEIAGTGTVDP